MRLCGFTVMRLCGFSVFRFFGYAVMRFFGYAVMRFFGYAVFRFFGFSVWRKPRTASCQSAKDGFLSISHGLIGLCLEFDAEGGAFAYLGTLDVDFSAVVFLNDAFGKRQS